MYSIVAGGGRSSVDKRRFSVDEVCMNYEVSTKGEGHIPVRLIFVGFSNSKHGITLLPKEYEANTLNYSTYAPWSPPQEAGN